jgi:hypothetical protein
MSARERRSALTHERASSSQRTVSRRVLAVLALVTAGVHFSVMWFGYEASPHEALWACHIAPLLLAVGCTTGSVRVANIATTWMILGSPLWFGNLVVNGEWPVPTAVLVHLGSLAIGLISVRVLGWTRGTWWRASLALLALAFATRLLPSAERHNVNLVFRVWSGLEPIFPNFAMFLAFLVVSIPLVFYAIESAFLRSAREHL